ncbi:hypothetical protein LOD99_6958 [Oopsacas minuta]|uniref:Uncharacterized protein n=1 Tax=Oopsacas minuta TaxID=111878 RepID=A0AAV7JJ19_9METZ|nr:hypothetical protein LOD99_6958 [Oopsacas minuta]
MMASFTGNPHSISSVNANEYSDIIEGKKRVVHEEFLVYHHQLSAKESQICSQLDAVCNTESDKFQRSLQPTDDMIKFLTSQVKDLQIRFQEKNMLQYVEMHLAGMHQFLEEKNLLEKSPPILSIKLKFDPNFRDIFDKICNIEQISIFRYDAYPVKYSHKQTPNESVEALAIDTATNRLFALVKSTTSCVKIFNTNDLTEVATFADQKIMFPNNLAIVGEYIFIVCDRSILKLTKSSIAIIDLVSSQTTYSGLAINYVGPTLYIGVAEKLMLNVFDLELKQIKVVQLRTSDETKHRKHTRIQHICIVQLELYILFSNTNHPFQSFTLNGDPLRCIIPETALTEGRRFCFDHHVNIFITDREGHRLKMFSNEGKLLHTIGHEGTAPGNFLYPTGLAIDESGSLFVTDGKDNAMLQKFVVIKPY